MIKPIPEDYKGLGLKLYCKKCKKYQIEETCDHRLAWTYKIVLTIPKSGGRTKTKTCKADNLYDALEELDSFKTQFLKHRPIVMKKEFTLREGISRFLQKKFGEGEFRQSSKPLSSQYRKDIVRALNRYNDSLNSSGYNPNSMYLNDLTEKTIAPYIDEVFKYGKSTTTKNKHIKVMRDFFSFISNRGMYDGSNFWLTVDTYSESSSPTAISDIEFEKVLSAVNINNAWGVRGKNRPKNYYRTWMKDMFILHRFTGLREEELYELRWDNLIQVDGEYKILVIHNLKVERLKGKKDIVKVLPVTNQFRTFLNKLHKRQDSNKIIETDLTFQSFKDLVPRAFTHFYKVAMPNQEHKVFSQIRKSYATDVSSILGDEAYKITDHSGNIIPEKHYIDKMLKALKMLEMMEGKDV